MESFQADDFAWNLQKDRSGHVTHLLLACRRSLQLLAAYHEVLVTDCTYKSNRFDVPLFNIVGNTASGSTFFVALTILKREKEEDFTWVLEQLKAASNRACCPKVIVTDRDLALMNALTHTFPEAAHLLCQWHINKIVEACCWPFFRDLPQTSSATPEQLWTQFEQDWHAVIHSHTVPEFIRQWKAMKTRQRLHSFALQ